jgi:hypothetical protein
LCACMSHAYPMRVWKGPGTCSARDAGRGGRDLLAEALGDAVGAEVRFELRPPAHSAPTAAHARGAGFGFWVLKFLGVEPGVLVRVWGGARGRTCARSMSRRASA